MAKQFNIGPIKQAFVRALRSNATLTAAVGSEGFHEGVTPPNVEYPFIVYSVVVASRSYTFGGDYTMIATIDEFAVSDDQVVAHNLDQALYEGLQDAVLDFSGTTSNPANEPSTLLCRRITDLSLVDRDGAGNKVYQVGGSFQIWAA